MRVPWAAPAVGGSGLLRKPTRWASSSPEVLRRVCLRCSNEGLPPGDERIHSHAVLQGRDETLSLIHI
eukprot:7324088-Alexandrium_andersonii.AAC.1